MIKLVRAERCRVRRDRERTKQTQGVLSYFSLSLISFIVRYGKLISRSRDKTAVPYVEVQYSTVQYEVYPLHSCE